MKASNRVLSSFFYLAVSASIFVPSMAAAFEIEGIEFKGANKISGETIQSYLSIEEGQQLDQQAVKESIQRLYKTGFFKDISIYKRDNGIVVVEVVERPSIANIEFKGNSLLDSDVLETALEGLGMKKGRVYNQSQMDQVVLDIKRRYQNEGYYAANIEIKSTELPRERIDLVVDINEGEPATIGRINLVGNNVYSDKKLKALLQTTESAALGSGDQYSKPKMQADIETIRSHYLDKGYAEFKVRSSQVSLSADKTKVFITINMTEGQEYSVAKIDYIGELIVDKEEIKSLTKFKTGDVFSRNQVVKSVNAIRDRLSEEGYAFAEVDPETYLNKEEQTIDLSFKINPKDRVYIRRIEINGNTRTRDHVVRREMRQFEAAPYSLKLVRQSKERLQRVGFFQNTDIETRRVSKDQVDLIVKVEEQPTGSLNGGIGYSQIDGFSFNFGISERNFIGSGNKLNLSIATGSSRKTADVGITNPYFTKDGVSLGAGLYFSEINAEELSIADYTTNNYGVRTNIGYPLSENDRINFGLKFDSQELVCTGDFGDKFCKNFIDEYGKSNSTVIASVGWVHNTTNSFYFPSKGQKTTIFVEAVIPGTSDLPYYKLFLNEAWYKALNDDFTLQLKTGLALGDAYKDSDELPFYENFYAGGIGSVRGFEPNSLGPSYDDVIDGSDRPKGGGVKLTGTAAVIFPVPFIDDSSNARMSLFVDFGNIYSKFEDVELNEVRASAGLGVSWVTPLAQLSFSLAKPITDFDDDEYQVFQFTLGAGF